jgi:hypothetical protein
VWGARNSPAPFEPFSAPEKVKRGLSKQPVLWGSQTVVPFQFGVSSKVSLSPFISPRDPSHKQS